MKNIILLIAVLLFAGCSKTTVDPKHTYEQGYLDGLRETCRVALNHGMIQTPITINSASYKLPKKCIFVTLQVDEMPPYFNFTYNTNLQLSIELVGANFFGSKSDVFWWGDNIEDNN